MFYFQIFMHVSYILKTVHGRQQSQKRTPISLRILTKILIQKEGQKFSHYPWKEQDTY